MSDGFCIGIVRDELMHGKMVECLWRTRHEFYDLEATIFVEGSVGSFDVGRNKVVDFFLRECKSDWLLTLDTDMFWTKAQLKMLLGDRLLGAEIISGTYCVNDNPPRVCAVKRSENGHLVTIPPEWKEGELIKVDGVGGGCMLISRRVLEDIDEAFDSDRNNRSGPWYRQSAVGASGNVLEPDHAFCQRAQQLGYDVYMDTSSFWGHIKPRILGWDQ